MKKWLFGGIAYFISLCSCMAAGEPWSSAHGIYTPSHLWFAPANALNPYGDGLPTEQRRSMPEEGLETKPESKQPTNDRSTMSFPSTSAPKSESVNPSCTRRADCIAPR